MLGIIIFSWELCSEKLYKLCQIFLSRWVYQERVMLELICLTYYSRVPVRSWCLTIMAVISDFMVYPRTITVCLRAESLTAVALIRL